MTSPPNDGSTTRRRLLLIPLRDYPDADDDYRKGIDEQITVATTWWGTTNGGFETVTPPVLRNRRDLENFVDSSGLRDAHADDVLVIYVTGHGYRGPSGSHVLVMPDGAADRMIEDGFPTEELVLAGLQSQAQHVLIIVNTCFANAIAADVGRRLRDLSPQRRRLQTLAVICSADFDQRPRVREFSTWMDRTYDQLRRSAGIVAEHLSVDEFFGELTRAARTTGGGEEPMSLKPWPLILSDTPTLCLPNLPRRQWPSARLEAAKDHQATAGSFRRFDGEPSEGLGAWHKACRRTVLWRLWSG